MKFMLPSILALSISAYADEDRSYMARNEIVPIKFDVCFISETHRDWNFRSGDIKKAIDSGKRVCSISMPQYPVDTRESQFVRNIVSRYVKLIDPEIIYIPRIHEKYVTQRKGGGGVQRDRVVYVDAPDDDMARRLVEVLTGFGMEHAKIWILYDPSTIGDKKVWTKHLKPMKGTPILVKTKNDLRRQMRKLSRQKEMGVIINLMSSVEDTEYSRYLDYEELKHEVITQNAKHLTVGIEETRINNEAIVFNHDTVDSKVRAFINKREFSRLNAEYLYLNNNWQYLGGFLSGSR